MGKPRIISRDSTPFINRAEAGRLLAAELLEYKGRDAVVLGIPRGGIVVAREIAERLDAELDMILARKLRTPGRQELAMGSVSEDGRIFLNEDVVNMLGVGESYIQREKEVQLAEIKRRTDLIRAIRPKIPLKEKIVIVTDDGVATGATTQAALWGVRLEQPARLVAAIPVAPEETIMKLAADVDEMICLRTPPIFAAVGQFYEQFGAVSDDKVLEILKGET